MIFPNGTALFHHKDDILDFLSSIENPNKLQLAVMANVSSSATQAGCKALALVDFLLIKPLWQLLLCSVSKVLILDMNE